MRYSSCGKSMATSMASCLILPLKKFKSKLQYIVQQSRKTPRNLESPKKTSEDLLKHLTTLVPLISGGK